MRVLHLFLYHRGIRAQARALNQREAHQHPMPSRKQLQEALKTIPDKALLGANHKSLTAKQKRFAREVAMGATKADAYREAYKTNNRNILSSKPYHLAADVRVQTEIQAIEQAIRAMEYQTPSALRALVINSLVQVVTNPDAKDSVRIAAAKTLGTVTEVAAFTERKEVRTIKSSEDARASIMAELRRLMNAQAEDARVTDAEADSLLAEIAGAGDPHPPGTPHARERDSAHTTHTIPPEQSLIPPDSPDSPPADPTPAVQETPPVDGT